MAAIPKAELERLERKHNLTEDGLTYQLRCSRISAVMKGEVWEPPVSEAPKRGTIETGKRETLTSAVEKHPLYGKLLMITPMMTPDKNRNVYYEEKVGHFIEVEEVSAGALLYGASEEVDRMVGDYKIVQQDPSRTITAKTTLPKSGQEISWLFGKQIVPVVRGNDGQKGYIWSFPTHMRQFGDTMIQLYGLKTLIQTVYPEALGRFKGKPVMSYIDGLVLVASIPQTEAIMKELRRKELQDEHLGLV